MKPHRDISNWFITNIRKEGRYVYADVEISRMQEKLKTVYTDVICSGTLHSIIKRIEKELK